MKNRHYRVTLSALCALSSTAFAVDVYRCTDANGLPVFSQRPCGPQAQVQTIQDLPAATSDPGRSATEQLQNYRKQLRRIDGITGHRPARSADKTTVRDCDRISALQLRNARISRDLMRCHSEDDVRNMYGAPGSIDTWSDKRAYDTRWTYRKDQQTLRVYFKNGRVTRWQNRHRPE